MTTSRTIAELRDALAGPRRAGARIALVPTMGALHDGHLALIDRARAIADIVVVSLFVNPAQFERADDLAAYPRDERSDARFAAAAGADVLFAPPAAELYPPGFATTVRVAGVTAQLEGAQRGVAHFDGVATIVLKLLNIAAPEIAVFGQKDAQQVAVVRRLVRDLDLPVTIDVVATVREADGLALSSRNARLDAAERERASALADGLEAARAAHAGGERDAGTLHDAALAAIRARGVEPEYVALVAPDDFTPLERAEGDAVLAVAARIGATRLIDNTLLPAGGAVDARPHPATTGGRTA